MAGGCKGESASSRPCDESISLAKAVPRLRRDHELHQRGRSDIRSALVEGSHLAVIVSLGREPTHTQAAREEESR